MRPNFVVQRPLLLFLLFLFHASSLIGISLYLNKVPTKQVPIEESNVLSQTKPIDEPVAELDSGINETITIAIGGDVMMDRHIRQKAEINGYDFLFEKIKPYFISADYALVNLEGPLTENVSISVNSIIGSPENYVFTFDPISILAVKNAGVDMVSLGNNHILNQGESGLESTKKFLNSNNVDFIGNPTDPYNHKTIEIKGKRISFFNYNEFDGRKSSALLIGNEVKKVRPLTDYIIVYTHWGVEYQTIAQEGYQNLAHQYIDNGADAVIGAHPHVVQQSELYKNKPIYYSLGNLIMDQYFEEEVQNGLIVILNIDAENLLTEIKEINTHLDISGQTQIVSEKSLTL